MIGPILRPWGARQLERRLSACAVVLSVVLAACGVGASAPAQALPTPSPSPTASQTPSPAIDACTPVELVARVTRWEAAAGHRVAHVELTTTGPTCTVSAMLQPQLVEGHGAAILDGKPPAVSPLLAISVGSWLTTLVQADDYCGPVPAAPVSVGFVLTGGAGRIVALPLSLDDMTGVPPCLAEEGSPGSIEMQAWAPSGPAPSTAHGSPTVQPVPPASPAAGATAAAACKPTDQDKYVWGPDRLAVREACVRVTGVVEDVRPEADGDVHILLALDPASRWLLTPANQGEMRGDLVVEPVCVKSASQEAAEVLCASDPDPFSSPFPVVGQKVWMEGRYVLDLQHGGWAELHPLYRWGAR